MKTLIGVLVCLMMVGSQHAVAQVVPDWEWAVQSHKLQDGDISKYGSVMPTSICRDAFGNIYIVGWFVNTLVIGNTIITAPYNRNVRDIFFAKYDSQGNILWVKHPEGKTYLRSNIALDSNGFCYITGWNDTAVTFSNKQTVNAGTFLAKYDSSGDIVWVINIGILSQPSVANAIAIDKSGKIYITGSFSDVLNIGGLTLRTFDRNSSNILLAKFDHKGNTLWAKQAGGHQKYSSDVGEGISVVGDADSTTIYVSGNLYCDTAYFEGKIFVDRYSDSSRDDAFIANYNGQGTLQWLRYGREMHKGIGPNSSGLGIATDLQKNVYICGNFSSEESLFDSAMFTSSSENNTSSYIAKFNVLGVTKWVKKISSINTLWPNSVLGININTNSNQSIYLSGTFYGGTNFNGIKVDSGRGSFILFLDKDGRSKWVQSSIGGQVVNQGQIFYQENIYISGFFSESANFGGFHLLRNDNAAAQSTLFLAKLGNTPSSVNSKPITSQNSFSLFPNPATSQATITYSLAKSSNVTLEIYDLLGRRMKLVSLGQMSAGEHSEMLGLHGLGDGVYLCRMSVGGEISSMMFTVLK